MNIEKKSRYETFKNFQETLQRQKIAKVETLKVERESYETANSAIKVLINSLLECESYLATAYERINVGIVCGDSSFVSGIDKIKTYEKQLTADRETLQEISKEIDSEVARITSEISSLNSQIY